MKVVFRAAAADDLESLYLYIREQAGQVVAAAYIERIEQTCLSLESLPSRGRDRGDILPGLRTIAFERRALIAYRIEESAVEVLRIFYGGRDYETVLKGLTDRA